MIETSVIETSVIGPPADPARFLDLPAFGGLLPGDWDCRHCRHALDVDVQPLDGDRISVTEARCRHCGLVWRPPVRWSPATALVSLGSTTVRP